MRSPVPHLPPAHALVALAQPEFAAPPTMAGLQTDDINLPGYAIAEHANDKYFSEKKHGGSADHIESDAASHELDGIHDGLEFPTDDERMTLRRVPDTIPWNAYRESPTAAPWTPRIAGG